VEKSQDYFRAVRTEILPLIPENVESVLDVGCGAGTTSRWLKEKGKVKTAVGIERDPWASQEAKKSLDAVFSADLESNEIHEVLGDQKFDLILCLDILEHLTDPWKVLKNLRQHLKPGGYILASIPNVRNFRVIVPLLLGGSWRYQESGILDSTHLRFFTKKSALDLFRETGFAIDKVKQTGRKRFSKTWWANAASLGLLRQFFDLQYLIRAKQA
jgi:2-polyprenyl-3-methyl-5-hydroxy-6-metoxy-1,4-benzoquinol methylase